MIGVDDVSPVIRCWRSRPFRSGRWTSKITQLGADAGNRARNSPADSNKEGRQPSLRIKGSRHSRTEISSSTTKTIGVAAIDDTLERRLAASSELMDASLITG